MVVTDNYDYEFEATVVRRGRVDVTPEDEVLTYRVHLHWLMTARAKECEAAGFPACEDVIWNDICKDWADLITLLEK